MTQNIMPAKGSDPVLRDVSNETYALVREVAREFTGNGATAIITMDGVFEIARRVILSDREAREKHDRHARGDFGVELAEVLQVAIDIADETDGDTYAEVVALMDIVHESIRNGFDLSDVGRLLGRHQKAVELFHENSERLVKLQGMLLALKEVAR